jgi:adenylate cyclase
MFDRFITSRWFQVSFLLVVLSAAVVLSFTHSRWREQIRNFTFDNYNLMQPRQASDSIVVVDIDEASLKRIGQTPWPRNVMAQLVTTLKEMGARVIVFDIVFPEPDRSSPDNMAQIFVNDPGNEDIVARLQAMPDHDEMFGQAIAQAGNVVTGFSFTNEPTDFVPLAKGIFRGRGIEHFTPRLAGATVNLKNIGKDAAGNGSFFVSTDTDGIIRRVPMLVSYQLPGTSIVSVYPSLALETIRVLDGEKGGKVLLADPKYASLDPVRFGVAGIEIGQSENRGRIIPTNARGEFQVYFAKSNPAWYIPAWKILDKSWPAEKINGKIVFIGTSAVGLKDIRSTPLDTFVPGVEVHLNIIDQILQGKFLSRSIEAEGLEAVAIFGVGLFIILCAPFIGALLQTLVVVIVLTAGFYAGWYAFIQQGMLVDVTYPAFSVLAIFMLSMIFTYLRTEREKRQVREAFGLYISPAFIEELARNPDKLKLGGETKELSVMFTDIRNFTTICEGLSPQEIIQMINDFLTPMSDMVMQNRGTIDKYIGDAMMAFWNAPLDDPDHARHACITAIGMQAALDPVNTLIKAKGGSTLLKVGIGINSGPCAVGNMGSKQRFAYSSLGDTVNIAARLENQTKTYGVPIIIGEETQAQASEFATLEIDYIRVKGKTKAVRIFALLGDEKMAQSADFKKLTGVHGAMMESYRSGDFAQTLKLAEECARLQSLDLEMLYDIYRQRIQAFQDHPPEGTWDGVYEAKTK